jgi:hypothetical protein
MARFSNHLGILIAYPNVWKTKPVSTLIGERYEQLFDGNNAHEMLDRSHLEMLDYLKRVSK